MKKMDIRKRTQWFSVGVVPHRPGVYETRREIHGISPAIVYSKWDGRKWRMDSSNVNSAGEADFTSAFQAREWRGLADNPGEVK